MELEQKGLINNENGKGYKLLVISQGEKENTTETKISYESIFCFAACESYDMTDENYDKNSQEYI